MQFENRLGERFQLEKKIGGGGEAQIWTLRDHPGMAAKIYHTPSAEREAKLNAMLARRPNAAQYIAWPTEILYQQQQFAGFCMPLKRDHLPIFRVYHPVARKRLQVSFQWRKFLHHTALNLATQVAAVHASGHVVGDLNESNVMVDAQSYVTLIDTDSFQVAAPSGQIFRCPVGKAEFTPPELQGVDFREIERTPDHDHFALAVLIFLLLMEGVHPFAGVLKTPESVGRVDLYAIRNGLFPHAANRRIDPPPKAPDFNALHPDVQQLFERCFVRGHRNPQQRPSAQEWRTALLAAKDALTDCANDKQHVYSTHLDGCPHCTAVQEQQKQMKAMERQRERAAVFAKVRQRIQSVSPLPSTVTQTLSGQRTPRRYTMHNAARPFRIKMPSGRQPGIAASRGERLAHAWRTTSPWLALGSSYTAVNVAGFPLLFVLLTNATSWAQGFWGAQISANNAVMATMLCGGLMLGLLQRWALRFSLLRSRQNGLLWIASTGVGVAASGVLALAVAISMSAMFWGGLVLGVGLGVAQSFMLRLYRFGVRERRAWIAINAVALGAVGAQWDMGQISALTYLGLGFGGVVTTAALLAVLRGTRFAPQLRHSVLPRRFQLKQMRLRHHWRSMGAARWWLGALLPLIAALIFFAHSVNRPGQTPGVFAGEPDISQVAPPLPQSIYPDLGTR